jgi:hypothetical protein
MHKDDDLKNKKTEVDSNSQSTSEYDSKTQNENDNNDEASNDGYIETELKIHQAQTERD